MRHGSSIRGAAALAVATLAVAGCGSSKSGAAARRRSGRRRGEVGSEPGRAMAEAKDSGLDAIVLSAVWSPDTSAAHDLPPLRRAVRAAVGARGRADPGRLPAQLVDPHLRPRPRELRGLRGCARTRLARRAPGDRRQRAESQPLLAAAVRGRRQRRRCRLLRGAPRRDVRRAEEPPVSAGGDRRRPRPARRGRRYGIAANPLSDRVHPRPRCRLPCERPDASVDGRVLDPRLRREPEDPALARTSPYDVDRDRRLPETRRAARRGVRRHARKRDPTCRSSTASTGSRRRSRRTRRRSTRAARSCRRSTRRHRPPTTARRSSSRAGSRQSECSVSSTSTTRPASKGCRAVCGTPTERRNRASTPFVRPRGAASLRV